MYRLTCRSVMCVPAFSLPLAIARGGWRLRYQPAIEFVVGGN
jgi:hypothetical protein